MSSRSRALALLPAVAGLLAVGWVLVTAGGSLRHVHPAYPVLLVVTTLACGASLWRQRGGRAPRTGWRRVLGVVAIVLGIVWLGVIAWLRPLGAVEPSQSAMASDARVDVEESATRIALVPQGSPTGTGVFFHPGALVDPRAYVPVLRPLAEAGHVVVISKPPLGIAFLSGDAFDGARTDYPDVSGWVLGGHSLGGVVAARDADDYDDQGTAPAVGLMLYASFPAGDISDSLNAAVTSISGSEDGLSTPDEIEASRADLPAGSVFTVIEGASHASFGDYGPQRGDGEATISQDEARSLISEASLKFVDGLR